MKKLLSLLSVLTISGIVVPTTIAASPYQKEKNKLENSNINYSKTNNLEILNRNKRNSDVILNGNLKEINYIANDNKEILATPINSSYDKYFTDKFNITQITGINNWDEFDLLYKNFSFIPLENSNNSNIWFSRKDGCGSSTLRIFDFKSIKISDTSKYNHDIESYDEFEPTFVISTGGAGTNSFKGQKGLDVPFDKYKEKIFDKKITYKLSAVSAKFFVTIQRYKINNDLILRLVYKLNISRVLSNSGINFIVSGIGNYKIS